MRILILGGTSDARALAHLIGADARFDALISLAGRTLAPAALPIATRVGGFAGADGLARFLRDGTFDALVDATHPFAVRISANAVAATQATGLPLVSLVRDPWVQGAGDRWTIADDASDAARALGEAPRRVFLTVGRLELGAFASAPQHTYVARTIDPPGDVLLPPDFTLIQARPPFDADAEARFLEKHRLDIVVSKNSGGVETYGKIAAARALGLPVILIKRPTKPAGDVVSSAERAMAWLDSKLAAHAPPSPVSSRRGV